MNIAPQLAERKNSKQNTPIFSQKLWKQRQRKKKGINKDDSLIYD